MGYSDSKLRPYQMRQLVPWAAKRHFNKTLALTYSANKKETTSGGSGGAIIGSSSSPVRQATLWAWPLPNNEQSLAQMLLRNNNNKNNCADGPLPCRWRAHFIERTKAIGDVSKRCFWMKYRKTSNKPPGGLFFQLPLEGGGLFFQCSSQPNKTKYQKNTNIM